MVYARSGRWTKTFRNGTGRKSMPQLQDSSQAWWSIRTRQLGNVRYPSALFHHGSDSKSGEGFAGGHKDHRHKGSRATTSRDDKKAVVALLVIRKESHGGNPSSHHFATDPISERSGDWHQQSLAAGAVLHDPD